MEERLVRSRGLLSIVVLAVTAGLCTALPAHAASSANAGRMSTGVSHAATATTAQCKFVLSLNTCVSTDPTVSYTSKAYGDTSGCIFVFRVTWGDGSSPTNVTFTDPADGPHLVGNHKYTAPGVYAITVNVKLTAGTCTVTNSVHTFTLTNLSDAYPWIGYSVEKAGNGGAYIGLFDSVSATWTEPTYPGNGGDAGFWVGLGGETQKHLFQIGTGVGNGDLSAAGWENGKKPDSNYYAWWEAYPDLPVFISGKKVAAGDVLRASVTADLGGLDGYTLTLTNISRNWTFTQKVGPVLLYFPASAEAVLESSTHHLAPGLSAISFSDISVNGKSMQKPDPAVIPQSEDPNYWGYVGPFSNNSFTAYPGS
jgi:hypothetical protein